jgi:hypothetical protein
VQNTNISHGSYYLRHYLNGSGDFYIHDGSGIAFTVKDDGENGTVGIGTNSPAANTKLHVVESAGTTPSINAGTVGLFQQNSGSSNWASVAILSGTSGVSTLDFGDENDQDVGSIDYSNSDNSMRFLTNTSERLRINSNGKIGIGTTSPLALLHIKQSETGFNDGIRLETSTASTEDWYLYMNGADDFTFRNDANDYVTFQKNTGNVGIGTTSPDYKLQVNGDVVPESNKTFDLGTSALAWDDLYYNNAHNMKAKSYTNKSLSSEIINFELSNKKGSKNNILDIQSLPNDLHDENSILSNEVSIYNYKLNYEQQILINKQQSKIESLEKQIQINKQNSEIQELKKQIQELKKIIQNK